MPFTPRAHQFVLTLAALALLPAASEVTGAPAQSAPAGIATAAAFPLEPVEDGPLLADFAFEELRRDGSKRDWGFIEMRGKPIVMVLWATWCGVCAGELPKLDALQEELGDEALVAVLSIDKKGIEHAGQTLRKRGFERLRIFHDTKSMHFASLGARGVPTAVIADNDGQIVARANGRVAWDSPAVLDFVKRLAAGTAQTP